MLIKSINSFKDKYIQFLLSLTFGMFGVLAFSPFDFWPASIISLTGLFIIILNTPWKTAIWGSLYWGIGFFSAGLHWIYIGINQFINTYYCINILLIVLLVTYLSVFPILFCISILILQPYVNKWLLISIAPILWSISERLRGNPFFGFPWLQFGYSQINGPIKGIAPILGVEGITFILIFISGLLALSIKNKQLLPIFISLITLIFLWPLKWIQWYYPQPHCITNISLVQGNIEQRLQWNLNSIQSTLQIYLQHTLPILKNTKIIIWPESAIPGNERMHNKFLTSLDQHLRKHQTYLITGIIDTKFHNSNYYHYNSIIVIGDYIPYKYPSINRYHKHHLVLCSERFPCPIFHKSLLKLFDIPISFMQKGYYLQPQLKVANINITAAVCYEIIFGNQIRDNFKPDSNFLLTVANDVWFGHSIGPWQHFQMTRMRALELGRPLLCSTNNGITAIIYADGSIQSQLPQFISGVLNADVTPTNGLTPYAKFGSLWLSIVNIVFIIYLFFLIKRRF